MTCSVNARRLTACGSSANGNDVALVVLRVVSVVVVLAFALIGFLYVTRGSPVRHVRGLGTGEPAVSPAEPEFRLSVAMLTGVVLLPNNHVELAVNGDGTFPALGGPRVAQRSIVVQMYYGLPGTSPTRLVRS
jgi:hypothetical protein